MRVVGLGLLALALVAIGGPVADASNRWTHNHANTCERNGVVYYPPSYCYTSCTPSRACEVDVCFSDGEWMSVGPCKVLDCRHLCGG